ncbi:MAG TPA: M20 family metallopeptidase [Candidatus Dormibacteraeota bacterium]|nr:M20 family metallopeptidase [Candidatus Dormibacteraeota bacterium]
MSTHELLEAALRLKPQLVADRRAIHQHPELAYQEVKTAALVHERLTAMGIEHRTGIAETGVIGIIEGSRPGRTVILRGDMDALPILEETPVPFASENAGVMHACGHDSHTAMLLGAAQLLNERRDQLSGTVKLMFQPAEEGGGGAKRMLDEGLLDGPPVDAAFMIHVHPELPKGKVGFRSGPSMAGMARFEIEVRGKGGHAARPHVAVDPVVISAHIVTALQTLVSREIDPAAMGLITLGSISSGTAANIIPDTALIKGTIRAHDKRVMEHLRARIPELAGGVAAAMRATAEVCYGMAYPPLACDDAMTELAAGAARELLGGEAVEEVPITMGSEDFAFVLEKVPGSVVRLGVKSEGWDRTLPVHTATFDIDEDALPIGAATMASIALDYLQS